MKKIMLLALIASASLYAKDTQEVKLEASHIKGSETYGGSVTANESKNMVIITKEDIEKKQYPDLVTIFKDSPVTMVTYTPAGPLIALRGSGEKTVMRVLVLLDGKKISTMDEAMGVIPFNSIPVSSIEKIEIVPGGGITLYGSGSSSGVINIVTKAGVTKDYGQINVGATSLNSLEISANKGMALGKKLFADVAVEAKKGHGYRDKEKAKKINLIAGINYAINDKNKIKFQGTKYKEDADSTKEISLKQIEKNRKQAGTDLTNTKSDRGSLSVDYEYKPTENLTLNAGVSKAKFTRDIKAKDRPYMTILPGGDSFTDLNYDNMVFDLAALNIPNGLSGKFEEKINTAKLSGDYKYKKGKLSFGAEQIDHNLVRKLNFNSGKMRPLEDINFLMHPKDLKVYTEEELLEMSPGRIELVALEQSLAISKYQLTKYNEAMNKIALKYADEEQKKSIESDMSGWNYYPVLFKHPDMNNDLRNLKMKDLTDVTTENGVTGIAEIDDNTGEKVGIKPIDLEERFGDFLKTALKESPRYDDTLRMQNIMNAKVDVNKKTNSFYLYNDYDISKKLKLNTGIRYEQAKYKGYRNTESMMKISGNSEKGWTKVMLQTATKTSPLEKSLDNYMQKSDYDEFKKGIFQERLDEMKKNGSATVTTTKLKKEFNKKEENIGGEIGLNYNFTDTDTAYVKFERAFNTPLPTQLTNKTWDAVTNMRLYWDSNLKTEKIHNFELGYRGMLSDNISLSIAGFMSQTKDEIVTAVRNGNSHMLREWRFLNIDKTRRLGLELQSEQVFDKLRLKESFTYVDPRIVSNDYDSNTRKIIENRIADYRNNYVEEQSKIVREYSRKKIKESITEELKTNKEMLEKIKKLADKTIDEISSVPLDVVEGKYKLQDVDKNYIESQAAKDKLAELEKKYKENSKAFEAARKIAINKSNELEENNKAGLISDEEFETKNKNIWDTWENTYKKELNRAKELNNEMYGLHDLEEAQAKTDEINVEKLLSGRKSLEELEKISDEYYKKYEENREKANLYKERTARKEDAWFDGTISDEEFEKIENKNNALAKPFNEKAKEAYKVVETIKKVKKFAKKYVIASKKDIDIFKAQAEWEMEHTKQGLLKKNERIPMVPKIKATFGADYKFTEKLEMGTTVTYVGSYRVLEPGRGYDLIISKVPGHLLTDIYGTYNFTTDLSARFGVNNLFNHKYNLRQDSSSGTPAPGRTYNLGVTYRF